MNQTEEELIQADIEKYATSVGLTVEEVRAQFRAQYEDHYLGSQALLRSGKEVLISDWFGQLVQMGDVSVSLTQVLSTSTIPVAYWKEIRDLILYSSAIVVAKLKQG